MNDQVKDILNKTRIWETNTVLFLAEFGEIENEKLNTLRKALTDKGFSDLGFGDGAAEGMLRDKLVFSVFGTGFRVDLRDKAVAKLSVLGLDRMDVNYDTLFAAVNEIEASENKQSAKRCSESESYTIVGQLPFGNFMYEICGACAREFIEGTSSQRMVEKWCEPNSVRILLAAVLGIMQQNGQTAYKMDNYVEGPETRQ